MRISNYKKLTACFLISALLLLPMGAFAQSGTHTVVSGDTMWKIAVKYQIGVSELIKANPQISNPALIYVGQKINIPSIDDVKALEQKVIDLVNRQRANYGLPLLKANWELCRVARYKSQDMINKGYFSHQSPTYGSPFKMMEDFGIRFTAAGENIAYGQRTPEEVMNSWMNSSGHKAANGTYYWTQMFIKSY